MQSINMTKRTKYRRDHESIEIDMDPGCRRS